jgi:hypothetical protein
MGIDEIVNRRVPKVLYHYTSQDGLIGIVDNKEIWATKAHYLNDSKEFEYAIDLVSELLEGEEYLGNKKAQDLRYRIGLVTHVNICVTSFTKNGDLLSQWRGYGTQGAGYSLGLSGAKLRKLAASQDFILCPVVYKKDQQVALVKEIIERWCNGEHHVVGLNPMQNTLDIKVEFEDYFAMLAPILKDPSFLEEQEWRLISPLLSCNADRFEFRAGQYSLLPYYRFSLNEPSIPFGLSKIVVGPSPMQELSTKAVESYLRSKGVSQDIVETSSIPYRGW